MSTLTRRIAALEALLARRNNARLIFLDVDGDRMVSRITQDEYDVEDLYNLVNKNPDVVFIPLIANPPAPIVGDYRSVTPDDLRQETAGGAAAFPEYPDIPAATLAARLEPWAFYDEMSRRMLRLVGRDDDAIAHGLEWPVTKSTADDNTS